MVFEWAYGVLFSLKSTLSIMASSGRRLTKCKCGMIGLFMTIVRLLFVIADIESSFASSTIISLIFLTLALPGVDSTTTFIGLTIYRSCSCGLFFLSLKGLLSKDASWLVSDFSTLFNLVVVRFWVEVLLNCFFFVGESVLVEALY